MKHDSQTGAKPIARVYQTGETPRLDVFTPEMVMRCPTKEHLEALLKWYGRSPFIRQVTIDSVQARRWYMEKARPAMRWYCKAFSVAVPRWLKEDTEFGGEEKRMLFGDKPLEIQEFEQRQPQKPREMKEEQGGQ